MRCVICHSHLFYKTYPGFYLQSKTPQQIRFSQFGFQFSQISRTSQFVFPKYLIKYQNVEKMKLKFKSEKSTKNKHKSSVVSKENEKKKIKIGMIFVRWPVNNFTYFTYMCLWIKFTLYIKIHLNIVLVFKLFLI